MLFLTDDLINSSPTSVPSHLPARWHRGYRVASTRGNCKLVVLISSRFTRRRLRHLRLIAVKRVGYSLQGGRGVAVDPNAKLRTGADLSDVQF